MSGTAVVTWWDDEGSVLARRGRIASGTDGVVVVAWSERPDQM